MDEIFKPFQPRGPLLPQSSMLEVLQECFGEWTKQIKPWKHKFNQVMFNIDLWGSGVGDSYWYMGLNIWSIYCSSNKDATRNKKLLGFFVLSLATCFDHSP